jgi:death on curing protein
MRYLLPSDVIRAHERVTGDPFDPEGFSFDELEAAVLQPREGVPGYEVYPSVDEKAAAIFAGLIRHRPFPRKNTPTAVLAVHAFYGLNGYELDISDDELLDIAHMAAAFDVPLAQIAVRFGDRSRQLPDP